MSKPGNAVLSISGGIKTLGTRKPLQHGVKATHTAVTTGRVTGTVRVPGGGQYQ